MGLNLVKKYISYLLLKSGVNDLRLDLVFVALDLRIELNRPSLRLT